MRDHAPTRRQFTLGGLLGLVTLAAVSSAVATGSPHYSFGAAVCGGMALLGWGGMRLLERVPLGRSPWCDVAAGLASLAALWLALQFGCAAVALAGIAVVQALGGGS
jgi:hypothetical protein